VAGYYWYVFNLADIAISLGVALLFYDMVRGSSSDHETDA
jgi:lipoprotein signal peptidase